MLIDKVKIKRGIALKQLSRDNFKHEGMKKHEGNTEQSLMNLPSFKFNPFEIIKSLLFPKFD